MKPMDLLKGKIALVMTDAKVVVELEIKDVKQNNHSKDLEESGPHNDWWHKTRDWTTFDVRFVNGFVKSYKSLNEIDLKE